MTLVASITIALFLACAAGIGGCGEDEEPAPAPLEMEPSAPAEEVAPATTDSENNGAREEVLEKGQVPSPGEDAASSGLSPEERAAVATARRYVAALDERDGTAVCELLVAGAIETVKLPRERGGCADSVDASIGYRDPRGLPVWESAEIEAIASIEVTGDEATVIPTVFTRFADRDEPSVEDDPIYLTRIDGEWRVAKPSLTFHRAIGQEPPPQALAPP